MSHDPTDDRLERLRDATSVAHPRPDFVGRVMARLAPQPRSWFEELFIVSRTPLRFAALLAALLLLLAIRVDRTTNQQLAVYETYEEEW